MLVLAHISDLHLDGSERATERAERVRDRLWDLPGRVDALLVTGDIADHGAEAEYEEVARILGDAPFPVLACPGNHDSRAPYRKALLGLPAADGPVNSVRVFDDAAVLMCDSSVPGKDEGTLEEETYDWIEATLDGLGQERRALLAFHHPRSRCIIRCRTRTRCGSPTGWPRCSSAAPRSPGSSPVTPTRPPRPSSPGGRWWSDRG